MTSWRVARFETGAQWRSRAGCEAEEGTKRKETKQQKKRSRSENGQEGQQVEIVGVGCPEMTQSQKDVVIQMLERNEGYWEIIKMISETGDEEHGMQCFRSVTSARVRV